MRVLGWMAFSIIALYLIAYFNMDSIATLLLPNRIRITTYKEANINDYSICWSAESKSDTVKVFAGGKQLNKRFKASGNNIFLLYYKDDLFTTFEHFRKHPDIGHEYHFYIQQVKDSIQVNLDINGPDQAF